MPEEWRENVFNGRHTPMHISFIRLLLHLQYSLCTRPQRSWSVKWHFTHTHAAYAWLIVDKIESGKRLQLVVIRRLLFWPVLVCKFESTRFCVHELSMCVLLTIASGQNIEWQNVRECIELRCAPHTTHSATLVNGSGASHAEFNLELNLS